VITLGWFGDAIFLIKTGGVDLTCQGSSRWGKVEPGEGL
jgi:hypothetical protein